MSIEATYFRRSKFRTSRDRNELKPSPNALLINAQIMPLAKQARFSFSPFFPKIFLASKRI